MPIQNNIPETVASVVSGMADKRPTDAIIYGIDGDRVDVRLGNSVAIVRHVEVVGDIDSVNVGDKVQITWPSTGRPLVMLVGSGMVSGIGAVVADNTTIENSSFGLRVKKGGIAREHLAFQLPDEGDVNDALTLAGWSVDRDSGVISNTGIRILPAGEIALGTGNDVIKISSFGTPDDPASPQDDTEYRLWIGHIYPYAAGFAVTKYGDLIARRGSMGGWTIADSRLYSDVGNAVLHAGARPFIGMGTDFYGGTGFWAGKDTDYVYKVSIGEAGGPILTFDGNDLTLQDIDLKFYYGTNLTLWIQSDGDFAIGQDVDTVSSTSLRIFSNDQTYNAEAFTAGDILMGDHSGAHMLWDESSGQLQFRDGSTTGTPVEVYIDTDGTLNAGGGAVRLDQYGILFDVSGGYAFPTDSIIFNLGSTIHGDNYRGWIDFTLDELIEDTAGLEVVVSRTTDGQGTEGYDSAGMQLIVEAKGSKTARLSLRVDENNYSLTWFNFSLHGNDLLTIWANDVVFNDDAIDANFRIETNSVDYALFIEGDSTRVQIKNWLELPETTAPPTGEPASGWGAVFAKTDGKLYFKNDGGTEYDLTQSGGTGEWTESGGFLTQGTATDIVQIQNWMEIEELTTGNLPTTGEPGTGFGAIYVKASDGKVYFKNDGGTEYDLTQSGGTSEWTESGGFLTQNTAADIVQIQNWLELEELDTASLPSTGEPGTGWGSIYIKASDGLLYFKDDGGTEYDITDLYTDADTEAVITAELVDGQSIDNAIDSLISTHSTVTDAHHAKYTDAEVETIIDAEIVDGQSIDVAIDALITTHTADSDAHHVPEWTEASGFLTQNTGTDVVQLQNWLELEELTTATLPTTGEPGTGFGAVYVKASDGKVYFKNDGGTEYDLTVQGGTPEWTEAGGFLTQAAGTDIVQIQNWMELEELTTGNLPTTGEPGTGFGAVYVKGSTGKVYFKNDGGTEYDLTATGGAGYWTDGTTHLYPTDTGDHLILGDSVIANADIYLGADGAAVFNEQGADADFRVESDNQEYMLFVDASTDRVGIGTDSPTVELEIHSTGGVNVELDLVPATGGDAILAFYRNPSGSLVSGFGFAQSTTNDFFELYNYAAGTDRVMTFYPALGGDGAVFNEGGADTDFRIEGDTNTHAFFVDGGADKVLIGNATGQGNNLVVYEPSAATASVSIESDYAAADQVIGQLSFVAEDAIASRHAFAYIRAETGSHYAYEHGLLKFYVSGWTTGLGTRPLLILDGNDDGAAGVIVNEDGIDHDFRAEGTVTTNLLHVNAGLDVVQIGNWLELAELGTGATPATGEPGSGWGALFVKASDGKVYFKNDGGTEYDLTQSGGSSEWTDDAGGFLYPSEVADHVIIGNDAIATADIYLGADGAAVFNEQSNDVDFRVESNVLADAFFVDGANSRVGIGTQVPGSDLEIVRDGSFNLTARFSLYHGSTSYSPYLQFYSARGTEASPSGLASADRLGTLQFYGYNISGWQTPASIVVQTAENWGVTGAGEGTDMIFSNTLAGATGWLTWMKFSGTDAEIVMNESGADVAFRVEGDAETHLIFTDAGTDQVAIGGSNFEDYSRLTIEGDSDYLTGGDQASVFMTLRTDEASAAHYSQLGTFQLSSGAYSYAHWTLNSRYDPETQTWDRSDTGQAGARVWMYEEGNAGSGIALSAMDETTAGVWHNMFDVRWFTLLDAGSVSINSAREEIAFRVYGDTIDDIIHVTNDKIVIGTWLGLKELAATPSTGEPATGTGAIYVKTDSQLYFKSDGGTEYNLTASGSSEWTDDGAFLYPAEVGDDVIIGANAILDSDIYLGADGSAIFNNQGLDSDFRVESNNSTHMIFADAGSDRVVISGQSDTAPTVDNPLVLLRSNRDPILMMEPHDSGQTHVKFMMKNFQGHGFDFQMVGDYFRMNYVDKGSGRGGLDNLWKIQSTAAGQGNIFFNDNSLDVDIWMKSDNYQYMFHIEAGTDTLSVGTATKAAIASFSNTLIVFNEPGDDRDFRVETDTITNALFIEGDSTRVQISSWLELPETTAPSTGQPASGWGAVFAKTDGKLYFKNDGGTEYDLTQSGGTGEWTESGGFLTQGTAADIVQVQNWLELEELTTANLPTTGEPGTGFGAIYVKASDGKAYFKNDGGTEYDITAGAGGSGGWTDGANVVYPTVVADDVIFGNTAVSTADIILYGTGAATFNEQAQNVDFRIEGTVDSYLFFVDADANVVNVEQFSVHDYIDFEDKAVPATPGAGYGRLYMNSDHLIYTDDSGGDYDLNAETLFDYNRVTISQYNSTAWFTDYAVTIPAGTLGPSDAVIIRTFGSNINNSGVNKSLMRRYSINAVNYTMVADTQGSSTYYRPENGFMVFKNMNSTTSNERFGWWQSHDQLLRGTSSINTDTTALVIKMERQWTAAHANTGLWTLFGRTSIIRGTG